ncbi:hypothetical protein [Mesobacillus harenae]|uniref:hypothetical protein n=1 Tax=Mesobacillus harenae TaxID=2213203 RepID=UPI00158014C5|nr:hypothetical protein [Mesobacillus harenae]
MGRGKGFHHKEKGHPGKFPEGTLTERHTTEAQEDEELIVVQEAFKNRAEEDEDDMIDHVTSEQNL